MTKKKSTGEGLSPEDSLIQAGERRLRPIHMTALATMAGMIPLVITPAVHYYLAGDETREVKS